MPFTSPSASTRRTRRVTLRLSDDERHVIERQAAAVGRPVATYLREVGLGRRLRARRRHVEQAAVAQLARIANNVRQLRRVAEGDPRAAAAVDELEATYAALQDSFDRLLEAVPADEPLDAP